jgi:hypothetical protein
MLFDNVYAEEPEALQRQRDALRRHLAGEDGR